jgi:hypothetical protein
MTAPTDPVQTTVDAVNISNLQGGQDKPVSGTLTALASTGQLHRIVAGSKMLNSRGHNVCKLSMLGGIRSASS